MKVSNIDGAQFYSVQTPLTLPNEMQLESRRLIQAVRSLNKSELLGQQNELTYTIDRDTRRPVVKVVDRETKAVLFQIPPSYVLELADRTNHESGGEKDY